MAFNGLKGELTLRASNFRKNIVEGPIYQDSLKGRIVEVIDFLLNRKDQRIVNRNRKLDEEMLTNPYKTALIYSDALLGSYVREQEICPEIVKTAIDTTRGFDQTGRSLMKKGE